MSHAARLIKSHVSCSPPEEEPCFIQPAWRGAMSYAGRLIKSHVSFTPPEEESCLKRFWWWAMFHAISLMTLPFSCIRSHIELYLMQLTWMKSYVSSGGWFFEKDNPFENTKLKYKSYFYAQKKLKTEIPDKLFASALQKLMELGVSKLKVLKKLLIFLWEFLYDFKVSTGLPFLSRHYWNLPQMVSVISILLF